jgi:nicotinate phosphoribosyltransferase
MSDPGASALLTDLYELAMLRAYQRHGMTDTAVFEFFVRRLPARRNFLIAAGLEQVLDFLESLRFTDDEIEWLRTGKHFDDDVLGALEALRFTGDVYAMPEGTVFFANEPILRVVAPMPQAQLVETRVVNLLNFQTLIASKAARCRLAAPERLLVDFGLRRAHGAEAGLLAARASYLAGFDGTSTVLAEKRFGIPSFGTMAHSFIEAHDSEVEAFERFARAQQRNVVLLIDTYDTLSGARRTVEVADRLAAESIHVDGVRLDSGDLQQLSREVRAILDAGGHPEIKIFASGGLDEESLEQLLAAGAAIDGFGVGTSLDVSADAPYLDCVYKLQEYAGRARRKRSEGKATWPGRKQVYRQFDASGVATGDVLTLEDDAAQGESLLEQVMAGGRRTGPSPGLEAIRDRTARSLAALPRRLRELAAAPLPYRVAVAERLRALAAHVDAEFEAANPDPASAD